jgi:hypothetical protein
MSAKSVLRPQSALALQPTVDHILARAHYDLLADRSHLRGVRNRRPCCYRCNQLRAACGHCCGILMLLLLEAPRGDISHSRRIIWPNPKDKRKKRWHAPHPEPSALAIKLGEAMQRSTADRLRRRMVDQALKFGV